MGKPPLHSKPFRQKSVGVKIVVGSLPEFSVCRGQRPERCRRTVKYSYEARPWVTDRTPPETTKSKLRAHRHVVIHCATQGVACGGAHDRIVGAQEAGEADRSVAPT